MEASDLVEVLCAAHLGHLVEGPFRERGGIMLVGPPGVLKTTFVSILDQHYQDCLMLSDINVKSLVSLRDSIAAGKINTLVLPELAKIYERADATALNVEGTIRALAAEGFSAASFEDSRINRLSARAMIIGAMTPATIEKRFQGWEESGFNRRFLFALLRLSDPMALENAAINWQRIDFRVRHIPLAPTLGPSTIPNLTTQRERHRLGVLVKVQPGGDHAIQLQVMVRVLAVLKWWYAESGTLENAMETVERFGVSLGKGGADIDISASLRRDNTEQDDALQRQTAARTLANRRWKKARKGKKKP